MTVLYMGTPDYARVILGSLVSAGHEVIAVVTQPDRPQGRKGTPVASPVKSYALEQDFTVLQPEKLRAPESVELIRGYAAADVFVVAAYGQILPPEVLSMPKYGCLNVHASLLPRYRGASPISQAILDGEAVTGVTVMYMDEGIDTGDIVLERELAIAPDDTTGTLTQKLAALGGDAVCEALDLIYKGHVSRTPQDSALATHTRQLSKSDGLIDWSREPSYICRQVRAMNPWPGAYTVVDGKRIGIWEAGIREDASLELITVQPPGGRRMAYADYLRGHAPIKG